uniref:(northern house mosquito) hypothetical protein n=1 Tax=Culex pipiens TaxID=7175 RepID=A0A8D8HC58_CULPI
MLGQTIISFGLILVLFTNENLANMHCLQCSSESDKNCAEGTHPTSECLPEEDSCYTRLVGGHVVRGCLLDLPLDECLNDKTCRSCVGNGCNRAYWPKCHQCGSGDVGCDGEQLGSPEFCGQIAGWNYCYARLNGGQVTRGCGFEDELCVAEPESCQICFNDGCNGLARDALKPTKCQSCVGSDSVCLEGNASKLSSDCPRLADACVTLVTGIPSSATVIRDCSELLEAGIRSCSNPLNDHPLCVSCQGDNCNDKRWLRCHQCRVTSLDSSCNDEHIAPAMFCANYRESNRCYTRVLNGFFERGCLSDFDVNVNVCNVTGTENCNICDGQACNGRINSAPKLGGLTIMFQFILAIYTLG